MRYNAVIRIESKLCARIGRPGIELYKEVVENYIYEATAELLFNYILLVVDVVCLLSKVYKEQKPHNKSLANATIAERAICINVFYYG